MEAAAGIASIVEAVRERGAEVAAVLSGAGVDLRQRSGLPGWDRLTIVCHLRYATEAFARLTAGALAHEPVAFYPEGRDAQRPRTLRMRERETHSDVVSGLVAAGTQLDRSWAGLAPRAWDLHVAEPVDNPDLGSVRLADIALFRLTELEVHGTDLQLGLRDWSTTFVRSALPFRIERLNRRQAILDSVGATRPIAWRLAPVDGPDYVVSVDRGSVRAQLGGGGADASIEATSRDLLALLLGRPTKGQVCYSGDRELGQLFSRVFPGP